MRRPWHLFFYETRESQRQHEMEKGNQRFNEYGKNSPRAILVANLYRVYNDNLYTMMFTQNDDVREQSQFENQRLDEILQFLIGSGCNHNNESSPLISLTAEELAKLWQNQSIRKYLMLFEEQFPSPIRSYIFKLELERCLGRQKGKKWEVLQRCITNIGDSEALSISKKEFNLLMYSSTGSLTRTGRVLSYYDFGNYESIKKINQYDGRTPDRKKENETTELKLPQKYLGETLKKYHWRVSGIMALDFYAVFRSIAHSFFGATFSKTSKKSSNSFLKDYLLSEDTERYSSFEKLEIDQRTNMSLGLSKFTNADFDSLLLKIAEKERDNQNMLGENLINKLRKLKTTEDNQDKFKAEEFSLEEVKAISTFLIDVKMRTLNEKLNFDIHAPEIVDTSIIALAEYPEYAECVLVTESIPDETSVLSEEVLSAKGFPVLKHRQRESKFDDSQSYTLVEGFQDKTHGKVFKIYENALKEDSHYAKHFERYCKEREARSRARVNVRC